LADADSPALQVSRLSFSESPASENSDADAGVARPLGRLSPDRAALQTDIRNLIDRVVIGRATIRIQLSEVAEENDSPRILTLPRTRPTPYRKREIVQGANDTKTYARPMPANARAILIEALRDAHRWPDELLSDPLTLWSRLLRGRARLCVRSG
jgi:hypothetical protein